MKKVNAIALKEWAVAIDVLAAGEQIILMRKGGIIEETRDFQLESKAFFLFPTYEHQRPELLKDTFRPRLEQLLKTMPANNNTVTLTSYAEVIADIEVYSQEELHRLYPLHIWTEYFAEERLKWKKDKPLHILILRVYKLGVPLELPMLTEYDGCKSWIRLNLQLSENIDMNPVMTETEFITQNSLITELMS
jgi:hypothetical protein